MKKLVLYNKKRDFKKTPEPKGKVSNKYKNLYIIQKHAASHLHYDFRLELHGVLLSWAVPKGPCLDPSVKRLAMHVEDHPVEYGNFEGIIPAGEYGGGTVMLWDKGTWLPEDEDPEAALEKGHLRFQLMGEKLKGRWNLIRFKKEEEKSWFLIKSKDEYARPLSKFDITLKEPNSVLTHKNLEQIAESYGAVWSKKGLEKVKAGKKTASPKKKVRKAQSKSLEPKNNALNILKTAGSKLKSAFPSVIYPELATLVDEPPEGTEWLHEIKLDGYRIMAFKKNKKVTLMSRNHNDWTRYFSNVAQEIQKKIPTNIILDGEIVLLDKNHRSNFQLLQNALGIGGYHPFIYYVFDLLYYDKYTLMSLPLIERKNILHQIFLSLDSSVIRYNDHIIGAGADVFKKSCEMQLEGIVSKNMNSIYQQKRTKSWLKTKCMLRQEFVIGGYSPPQGSRSYFGSLYLGYYDNKGRLQFCGNVGTGFNQSSLQKIYQQLQKNVSRTNPFTTNPPGVTSAIWVKPKLVAEVEFSEWTSEGILRHPSFKGLRTDKPAKEIVREREAHMKMVKSKKKPKLIEKNSEFPITFTNPDKKLYPESKITKRDIALYYDEIQEWILPYIVNRPLTIVRCPENYKECFYQKHINKTTPKALYGIEIQEKNKRAQYIYIKDVLGLMSLVQMSTLEIHPWGSKIEDVEFPDTIIFDLDPAPDVTWQRVVAAAKYIKKQLAAYKLKSFVKTTGGKGLHVVIPIKPEFDWEEVKKFARTFVDLIVASNPEEYVSEMSKIKRKGKIFVDYLRNQRGATAIAPYSTRSRPDAPVSVPLNWDELTNRRADTFYTIKTLPERLKRLRKDPWRDFYKVRQSLL